MHLAWLTDIHLNFLEDDARRDFASAVAATGADGVVVTGDIAEAESLVPMLEELAEVVARPVWFVLGNHDFYGSGIAAVRDVAARLTADHDLLRWLPAVGAVDLGDEVALIGHDGWGDARLGNVDGTTVELSDFLWIDDLRGLARDERHQVLRDLGDEAAHYLDGELRAALVWARHVIVATHVPPFRDACCHGGKVSDDDWLPYFTCDAVGRVLRAVADDHPAAHITVLCGHTHDSSDVEVGPNLRVVTGGAEYGAPAVQRVLATHDLRSRSSAAGDGAVAESASGRGR